MLWLVWEEFSDFRSQVSLHTKFGGEVLACIYATRASTPRLMLEWSSECELSLQYRREHYREHGHSAGPIM
jgi:hypothetical protein